MVNITITYSWFQASRGETLSSTQTRTPEGHLKEIQRLKGFRGQAKGSALQSFNDRIQSYEDALEIALENMDMMQDEQVIQQTFQQSRPGEQNNNLRNALLLAGALIII